MRFGIFLLLVIVLAGGSWVVFENMSTKAGVLSAEEKKKAMTHILDRDPVTKVKGERSFITYQGKHISFSYPADAKVYKNNPGAAVLESFSCGVTDPRVNVSVQVMVGADVSDSSAVTLRRSDTKVYQETAGSIGGHKGIVFTKNESEGVEKSGFVATNGLVYSIVVSGFQLEAVEEMYHRVTDSINF